MIVQDVVVLDDATDDLTAGRIFYSIFCSTSKMYVYLYFVIS